jgi:hypothetical protein
MFQNRTHGQISSRMMHCSFAGSTGPQVGAANDDFQLLVNY